MERILGDLPSIRRKFHQYPELNWTEFWTTATLCHYLESMNYNLTVGNEIIIPELRVMVPEKEDIEKAYQRAINLEANPKYLEKTKNGLTGVMGILDTGKSGPTFQYEAEIDGLPITESKRKKHLPAKEGWRSKIEGQMHACGHDVHIAIALGIANYISENIDNLKGKYIFTFTPAEEGGQGARSFAKLPMMKEIDYYFSFHDASRGLGDMFFIPKTYLRSIKKYNIEFTRRGGGGPLEILKDVKTKAERNGLSQTEFLNKYLQALKSDVQNHSSPIIALSSAITNINSILKRLDGQYTFFFDKLKSGKYPGYTTQCSVTIRADNNSLTHYLEKSVKNIVKHSAAMYNVDYTCNLDKNWNYKAWNNNDPGLISLSTNKWKNLGYGNTVIDEPFGEMGSDDDVYMMNEIYKHGGKCLYSILVSDTNNGAFGELHTRRFNVNDELMEAGVNLIIEMINTLQ